MTKKISPRKSSSVSELSDLLSQAKSVAVVDYTGMTVSQATQLRRDVKKAGGEMKIAKNTLFRIALKQSSGDQLSVDSDQLSGLSAFIFSTVDEVAAIKAVADFGKKANLMAFKMGMLGDRVLTAAEVTNLANVPSKETLLTRLAYSCNWGISQLVRTLDAVSKKGGD